MINAFNSTLQAGLAGKPGVVMIDAFTQGRDQIANSAQYSLSNVTDPACSKTSPANPLKGNSLTCTPNSTNAGDTSKYLFADDVHLTPFGYQLLAQFVTFKLIAAGWL
jgi:outer membrane lipase/esterase